MRNVELGPELTRTLNLTSASLGLSGNEVIRSAVAAAIQSMAEHDPQLARVLKAASAMPLQAREADGQRSRKSPGKPIGLPRPAPLVNA